jgi:hypothetical protein
LIEPNWILLFSKKRGRWWVRLLACGRYHHVKAIAFLPAISAWVFYDVKFNGTRLGLARDDDPGTRAFLQDYLHNCDLVVMPWLPVPQRVAPHAGFWCTLAMKHLVRIRTGALRPDPLLRDCVAAGGQFLEVASGERSLDSVLALLKVQSPSTAGPHNSMDEAAYGRQKSELVKRLRARTRARIADLGALLRRTSGLPFGSS